MRGLPGALLEATDAAIELLQHSPSLEIVGEPVLERIAQATHCEWAVYWALDPQSRRLHATGVWSALGKKGEHFEQDTRVRTLVPHSGNAWHVWRSRKPLWATDLILEMCLPRSLDASRAGLRGGVWFGVQTDTAVYGVIELMARVMVPKKYETVVMFERTGVRLGYALEELRAARTNIH